MGVYYYGAVALASIALGVVTGVGVGLSAIRLMEIQRRVAPMPSLRAERRSHRGTAGSL